MKTFDEALEEETKRHRTDLDSQGCGDRERLRYLSWFREGARWAENSPELIKEVVSDVLNWLDQNPHEWEYGGDSDEIIDNFLKSKK